MMEGSIPNTTMNDSLPNNTSVTYSDTSNDQLRKLLIQGSQGVLALLIIFANVLILVSLKQMGKKRLSIHLWLGLLAVTDFSVGLTFGTRFVMDLTISDNETLCRICLTAFVITVGTAASTSLAMSIKTYIVIRKVSTPMPNAFTNTRSTYFQIISVCIIWIVIGTVGSIITLETSEYKPGCRLANGMLDKAFILFLSIAAFAHVVGIALCQFGIFYKVKEHTTSMVSTVLATETNIDVATVSMPSQHCDQMEKVNEAFEKEEAGDFCGSSNEKSLGRMGTIRTSENVSRRCHMKDKLRSRILHITKLTSTVVILFTCCWTPFGITTMMHASCFLDKCPDYNQWILITATFLALNSLINVVVYAFKSKEFRGLFKIIICCCLEGDDPNDFSSSNSHELKNSVKTNTSKMI